MFPVTRSTSNVYRCEYGAEPPVPFGPLSVLICWIAPSVAHATGSTTSILVVSTHAGSSAVIPPKPGNPHGRAGGAALTQFAPSFVLVISELATTSVTLRVVCPLR